MESKKKGRRFPAEVLTRDEVTRLFRAVGKRSSIAARNRALLAVGYRCGLRVNEALSLLPKDVDLTSGWLRVLCGKGGKTRTVGMDNMTIAILGKWLERRGAWGLNGEHPIFCSLKGTKLYKGYVAALMIRLGRRAGIEKRVHYHGLRHTYACELMKEKFPIMEIKENLGHANLNTTAVYLNHIAPAERIESARKREWKA